MKYVIYTGARDSGASVLAMQHARRRFLGSSRTSLLQAPPGAADTYSPHRSSSCHIRCEYSLRTKPLAPLTKPLAPLTKGLGLLTRTSSLLLSS